MADDKTTATGPSADPLGDLVVIFRRAFGETVGDVSDGFRMRRGIEAVEKAVNHRWLDMLPPGALMCGCGDIVQTEHECENCQTADWASRTTGKPTDDLLVELRYLVDALPLSATKEVVSDAVREIQRLRTALTTLVDLKDGPRDEHYRTVKDAAWRTARAVLGRPEREA